MQLKQSVRAAVATSFDDSLPDFLLPFIAEHVRALEAANAQAAAVPAPRQHPEWTKVKPKRPAEGRAPRTAESLITLQSDHFRCAASSLAPLVHLLTRIDALCHHLCLG